MKNLTAVQWLLQEIQRLPLEHRLEKQHLYAHALEMEKQQVMQAFYNGTLCDEGFGSDYAEEYYNQEYESEE
jgi:hypothetical protein